MNEWKDPNETLAELTHSFIFICFFMVDCFFMNFLSVSNKTNVIEVFVLEKEWWTVNREHKHYVCNIFWAWPRENFIKNIKLILFPNFIRICRWMQAHFNPKPKRMMLTDDFIYASKINWFEAFDVISTVCLSFIAHCASCDIIYNDYYLWDKIKHRMKT